MAAIAKVPWPISSWRNYTAGEYGAWLETTGFSDIRTVRFDAAGANGAVIARKPERS